MIITEMFYGIKCDRCDEAYDDGEHSFWSDESSAIENACDSDWKEVNGKYYCSNCCEVNEDTDEIKVFEQFPLELKTLNAFIDKILKGVSRKVLEYEDSFVVKCHFYYKIQLDLFEVDYIKNLLGEKFISLDYKVEKYNRFDCFIKIKK